MSPLIGSTTNSDVGSKDQIKSVLHDNDQNDDTHKDDKLDEYRKSALSTNDDTRVEGNDYGDETSSLLSSDDYDDTDNHNSDDESDRFLKTPNLSPADYLLTLDDVNRF